jgi:predicted MFS family arabinose efflux permease
MIDQSGNSLPASWWKPRPLTFAMLALAGWCVIVGWIAMHRQITGSDPAGNGMATGFVHGFVEAGVQLTGLLAGLYLLIRWRPGWYAFVAALFLLSLAMIILVR